jgi:hypothetical protein
MESSKFTAAEIDLSAINLRQLLPVRQVLRHYGTQDHSRWIFRGTLPGMDESVYVKVWNPSYVRQNTLPAALEASFLAPDTTPALRGIVTSDGLCRGYVMAECRRRVKMSWRFFQLICRRTLESGFFAVQFSPAHTLRLKGRFSMIDLEGVYPLEKLNLVQEHYSAFAYRPYAEFVARHLNTKTPPVEPTQSMMSRLIRTARRHQSHRNPVKDFRLDLIEP